MKYANREQMKELAKYNENFHRINIIIKIAKIQKDINELKKRFNISDYEIDKCMKSLNDTKN